MPDIHFNCSKCTQRLVVDAAGIGLTVQCPTCGFQLVIPAQSSPRPVAPEIKPPEIPAPKEAPPDISAVAPENPPPKEAAAGVLDIPATVPPKTPSIPVAPAENTRPKEKTPDVPVASTKNLPSKESASKTPVQETQKNILAKDITSTPQKLAAIILRNAEELHCEINWHAALLIARSSNGTPTDAALRARRVLEYARSGTLAPVVTLEIATKALKILFPETREKPSQKGKS